MRNNTTKALAAIVVAGASVAGFGVGFDAANGLTDQPTHFDFEPKSTPCVEDEYTERYTEFTLCVHVEGDGWRVVAN
jgi:hypothetical protein